MAGRGRPRQLTLDGIIDGAFALTEEHGVDALSMHTLAKRLGVVTGTLYGYVSSRDELIDLMLGQSLAEQPPVPDPGGREWTEALIEYLLGIFRANSARPTVMQLALQRPGPHLGAAALWRDQLAFLEAVGYLPERAAEVWRILLTQYLGHIFVATALAGRPASAIVDENPRLRAAQRHLDHLSQEQLYESALRALVRSLAAELKMSTP